jgi:ferredoxin
MAVPVVDQSECISCGLCIETATKTFRFNAQNKSEVIDPHGDPEELIQEAIDNCPVSCISWEDE